MSITPDTLDPQKMKTQTAYSLSVTDIRRATAAYEMVKAANTLLETLPIPTLEALRDYAEQKVRCRTGDAALCDRHYVDHLNYLIRVQQDDERRLVHGLTGVVPPEPTKPNGG